MTPAGDIPPSARMLHGLVAAAALVLLLTGLGARDLWAPDEPRLAAVAEEMRSMEHGPGGLVLLHLNGVPYSQKPPLYYWLAALAGSSAGRVGEWAARIPSAMAGVGCVLATLSLAGVLFRQHSIGLVAAALLLTSSRFVHLARRAQLDVLLALFETLALLIYVRLVAPLDAEAAGSGDRPVEGRRRGVLAMHACVGLAALVKGPVGWLPIAIASIHLLWEGRRTEIRALFSPLALVLSIGPLLLWFVSAAALAPPGFIDDALVDNVLGRFFSGTSHARPFYYYVYQFPLDYLPWTFLLPLAWLSARRHSGVDDPLRPVVRLLVVWTALPFVIFSLSAGKRGLYLLPIYPAVCLLAGLGVVEALGERQRLSVSGRISLGAAIAATGLLGCALLAGWNPVETRIPDFSMPGTIGAGLLGLATITAIVWATALRRGVAALGQLWIAIALVAGTELIGFAGVLPALDVEKSPRPIAEAAAARTDPNEAVGVYGQRSLEGGIGYYARRPIRSLADARDLKEFIADGGRVIVGRADRLEPVAGALGLSRELSVRTGKRRLLLVDAAAGRSEETLSK